eukprot:jgi/Ulvmu1/918/UM102_0001.1
MFACLTSGITVLQESEEGEHYTVSSDPGRHVMPSPHPASQDQTKLYRDGSSPQPALASKHACSQHSTAQHGHGDLVMADCVSLRVPVAVQQTPATTARMQVQKSAKNLSSTNACMSAAVG